MRGSTAVGSISPVTTTNVASPSARRLGQGRPGALRVAGSDPRLVVAVSMTTTVNSDINVKVKGVGMRIGELSRRTGVATRLLRYYEEQGLLTPGRAENGYRAYAEGDVALVERIALLVRSGVPTRLIRPLLELEGVHARELAATCSRAVAELLAGELDELDARISCLTRSRETIRGFLARTEHAALLGAGAGTGSPG